MYGSGNECKLFEPGIVSGTTPATSDAILAMSRNDIAGAQLVVDDDVREVDMSTGTNGVDASDKAFTLANFTFTGLVGAVVTIENADEPGNDGSFTITSVTSPHVAVASGASGLVDETFGTDVIVTVTMPPLGGAWSIEISCDTTPDSLAGDFGQDPGVEGHWTDITDAFRPAIAEVAAAEPGSYSQFAQATICVRAIRFTFTPTGGFGRPLVLGQLRSYFGG